MISKMLAKTTAWMMSLTVMQREGDIVLTKPVEATLYVKVNP
jgi:hypothetical protein